MFFFYPDSASYVAKSLLLFELVQSYLYSQILTGI